MKAYTNRFWYEPHLLSWILWPFSLLFQFAIVLRRYIYKRLKSPQSNIPIVVVGNITVGGVGKTPLVIELAKQCFERGLKPAIVSRGYGALITEFPYEVSINDSAGQVGDEPLLIARKARCPVVIAPRRMQAVQYIEQHHSCNIIISDDGLQHYAMGRAIEIAVIDGTRGLGNGFCLPAGPLREPKSRLNHVDFIVVNEGQWPNAYLMQLKPQKIVSLKDGHHLNSLPKEKSIAAVAGIGNPQRFFSSLQELGVPFSAYSFPDHYQFKSCDLDLPESMIIMTEKDAVKCKAFAKENMYVLPVKAALTNEFWNAFFSHPAMHSLGMNKMTD